ncbi:MAG: bifunctional phosphopantothenoylcysteine decarboxylase/phosphopantothenate--cysteine ligase CoaBC, partial [Candidatus Thermoplasmatota archaeon]
KSKKLQNKRIVLGVTGSISSVETIRLARELIRHGAHIIPVMSRSATRIIHPDALEFATGVKPIIELSGRTEHVSLCGLVKDPVDLLLICPCTANTLSKISNGIDDTTVTTFASTAIGSGVPVIIVPSMHLSMYNHSALQKNIERCRSLGITVIEPSILGAKAKMPDIDLIVANVIRTTEDRVLDGKKILVIGGATAESIDDIRIITNRSSGKTAIALATVVFEHGGIVELWYGYSKERVPSYIPVKYFETINDLIDLIKKHKLKEYDIIIICAALPNYIPIKYPGKIPSGNKNLNISFKTAPVVLKILREKAPDTSIIAFKTEDKKYKIKKASIRILREYDLDAVIGNTTKGFGSESNEIIIIKKDGRIKTYKGKKDYLAERIILDIIK